MRGAIVHGCLCGAHCLREDEAPEDASVARALTVAAKEVVALRVAGMWAPRQRLKLEVREKIGKGFVGREHHGAHGLANRAGFGGFRKRVRPSIVSSPEKGLSRKMTCATTPTSDFSIIQTKEFRDG
jgi:hypothetical protein